MSIDYDLLPSHLQQGMSRYLEHGIETGSFLRAVLENDFEQAILRADPCCLRAMRHIALFLGYVPPEAWGSRLIVESWIDRHKQELKGS
jgi:DNA-directed RNA polymerase specialized sigma24 family protein